MRLGRAAQHEVVSPLQPSRYRPCCITIGKNGLDCESQNIVWITLLSVKNFTLLKNFLFDGRKSLRDRCWWRSDSPRSRFGQILLPPKGGVLSYPAIVEHRPGGRGNSAKRDAEH